MNYKGNINKKNVFKLSNLELNKINQDLKNVCSLNFKDLKHLQDNLYNYSNDNKSYLDLLFNIAWNVDRYCWNDYINHF